MRAGRWSKPVTIKAGSDLIKLLPTPIRAAPLEDGVGWSRLGTPQEATAKAELLRMHRIYERAGAVLQPLAHRTRADACAYEVVFPAGRWQNGPRRNTAWEALLDNYARNHFFKGVDPLGFGDGASVFHIDRIMQDSARAEAQATDQLLQETHERLTHDS